MQFGSYLLKSGSFCIFSFSFCSLFYLRWFYVILLSGKLILLSLIARLHIYFSNFRLVNGTWSEWRSWGACSGACNNGTRLRVRECSFNGTCTQSYCLHALCPMPGGGFGKIINVTQTCSNSTCSCKYIIG